MMAANGRIESRYEVLFKYGEDDYDLLGHERTKAEAIAFARAAHDRELERHGHNHPTYIFDSMSHKHDEELVLVVG